MKRKYYLAYGSNLNVYQMAHRCPHAYIAGIAVLNDYRLLFRGSKTGSYLTVEPCPGSKVPVGVWSITSEDEKSLDRYEGFPAFYRKETVPVLMYSLLTRKMDLHSVEGLIYIMDEQRPLGIPSYSYWETVQSGYRDFGFASKPLDDALSFVKKEVL